MKTAYPLVAALEPIAQDAGMLVFEVLDRHTWEQVWLLLARLRERAEELKRERRRFRRGQRTGSTAQMVSPSTLMQVAAGGRGPGQRTVGMG